MATYTPTQDGYHYFGTWNESAVTLRENLIIDYASTFETRTAADYCAAMLFTNMPKDTVVTGMTLRLTAAATVNLVLGIYVRAVDANSPSDWSNSNLPMTTSVTYDDYVGGTAAYGGVGTIVGAVSTPVSLSAGETVDVTLDYDMAMADGDGWIPRYLRDMYRQSQRFALVLDAIDGNRAEFASRNHSTYDGPQLITTETLQYTGLDGVQGNSRVDTCPICGFRSLRETWIMSGWLKRLVCPQCYDPEDREDKRRPVLPEDRLGLNPKG
jgi:hypothetical protein